MTGEKLRKCFKNERKKSARLFSKLNFDTRYHKEIIISFNLTFKGSLILELFESTKERAKLLSGTFPPKDGAQVKNFLIFS